MKDRYRFKSSTGYPVDFSIGKQPRQDLYKHITFPEHIGDDIVVFAGKMVESGPNMNRAFFDHSEMLAAYETLVGKAVDLEHEVDNVVGHIFQGHYINRTENSILDIHQARKTLKSELNKIPIDVVIGGIVYIDRFPMIQGPIEQRRYALSMECYLSDFSILLENGTLLRLDEAEALGLGEFIDQLMGEFVAQEEFERAHTLQVVSADGKTSNMKIYKYLHNISWSGVALTINPACPSCALLSTSSDEGIKEAASCSCQDQTESKVHSYSLDLRKVDSYMKKMRDTKEIPATNIQVAEQVEDSEKIEQENTEIANEIEMRVQETVPWTPDDKIRPAPPTLMPPPSTVQHTPVDIQQHSAVCLNYKVGHDVEFSCLFADQNCETAGDRKSKQCKRWFQDERGIWKFDTRNHINDGKEEVVVNTNMEDVVMVDEASRKKDHDWVKIRLEKMENDLEVFRLEREASKENASIETAGTWTTKTINGFPNSSFAVVETGYKEGMNKNARHLPFKDGSGKVDLPHLRNALARANQIKNVLGNDSDADLRARAQRKLAPYAKRFLKTSKENEGKE